MPTKSSRFAQLGSLKLVMDFVVLSGGQVLSKIVGFVAFAYLARVLGPQSYGSVEYAVSLAAFCSMVVNFGLGPVGVRELARSDEKLVSLTSNIPMARLVLVAAAMPVMALAAFFSREGTQLQQLVWIYALSLLALPWALDWLFQARDMMGSAAGAQLLRMLVFAIGVVLFVKSAEHVLWVGYSELAAALAMAVYYLWIQHAQITPISLRFSLREVKELFIEGVGVGSGQTVSAINMYAPVMLVANLVGGEQTAWFGASHRVVASLSTFSLLYHFNLYPVLARKIGRAGRELDDVVTASTRIVGWVSIGGALALTLMRSELVEVVYGAKFVGAASTFGVLVWYLPTTLLSGHARWVMIAAKGQRYVLYAQMAGALVGIGLGIPLVIAWHAEGAAIAMVAGSLAVWVAAHLYANARVRKVGGTSALLLPAGWALLVGAVAESTSVSPWISAPIAALLYFGLAPMLDRNLVSDFKILAAAKSHGGKGTHAEA